MEFPELGEHCSWPPCQRLDFLPLKCDACQQIFCTDHVAYAQHACTSAYKKDVQVPVCPLCNTPVPVRRGEMPDVLVGEHIDRHCKADPAQRQRKIFTNKCLKPGCKQKEMMKVICEQCHKNYCLKHRHPLDHDCSGAGHSLSKAGHAALARAQASSSKAASTASSGAARPCRQPLGQGQSNHVPGPQHLPASCRAAEWPERGGSAAARSGAVPGGVSAGHSAATQHAGGGGPGTGTGAVGKRSRVPAAAAAGARLEALQLQHVVGGAPAEVVAPGAAVASHGDAVRTPWMLTGARHHLLSPNAHGQLSPACRGCSKPPGGAGLGRAQAHASQSERRCTEGAEPAAGALAPLGRWGEGRAGLGGLHPLL
nr:AN1-type zinc finger protein 2B isoform X2 [Anas platyrhynchos]